MVEKRAAKKGKSKQEAGEPEIDKENTVLYLEDKTIKKVLHEVIMHPMANAGVVFNNLGSKQPKYWKSEEILLTLLLEVLDGEHLALIKINEIDMTEPVIPTEASEEFKQPTEPKEEEEPKADKETDKEKLNQRLNTLNEKIY